MTTESSESFVAAVVQAAPAFLDLEAGIAQTVRLIDQAGAAGARMIAFPELWLPGYPWWIWLGTPAWAAQRGLSARYRDNAFEFSAAHTAAISAAARRNRMVVVLGMAERDHGSLYISQWFIDADGQTRGRRRKLKPGAPERAVFGEGDARHLAVVETAVGRVGGLCCGEHRHPLFKMALHAQGERIHVAAWPSFSVYQPFAVGLGPEVNTALSRVYAAEGGCFVLAPCAVVSAAMVELLCDNPERAALLRPGGGHARAFGPSGESLAEPLAPEAEGLLMARIDLAKIAEAKAAYDVTGHSARPDVAALALAAAEPFGAVGKALAGRTGQPPMS
ncbi:MAG: carbon-nitrogen hydrolase family protein [Burkholderiales bacterium]|nr:carbon-nitrogen hydrolase family protein [Burkholderiales bacterium]